MFKNFTACIEFRKYRTFLPDQNNFDTEPVGSQFSMLLFEFLMCQMYKYCICYRLSDAVINGDEDVVRVRLELATISYMSSVCLLMYGMK